MGWRVVVVVPLTVSPIVFEFFKGYLTAGLSDWNITILEILREK